MPDILRHGGRGLLEGVLTIWQAMNDIMCLHQDNLVWVVNPMTEINTDALVDPTDVNTFPGKEYLTRDTVSGQQAVRNVERRSRTNEILANMQFYDQHFQRGSFVPDNIQGLPGWRQEITFREAAMNLDQALSIYSLMGENVEEGAVKAVEAALDIIYSQASYNDYKRAFSDEDWAKFEKIFGIMPDPTAKTGVRGIPKFNGTFHISGIQALMKDNETLLNLKQVIIPLAERPAFAPYINAFKALKAIERRVNLEDEGVIATEEEAKMIDLQQQLASAGQKEAMERLQQLQEALGIAELAEKLSNIESGDIQTLANEIKLLSEKFEESRERKEENEEQR
jgi:hypothetical protein